MQSLKATQKPAFKQTVTQTKMCPWVVSECMCECALVCVCVCEVGSMTAWTFERSLADLEICLFQQGKSVDGSHREEEHLVWLILCSVMSAV